MHDATFSGAFRGKNIVVTGHSGFKGGWLSLWLASLGARVTGIALAPPAGPSFFASVGLDRLVDHRIADIRSAEQFAAACVGAEPEILIHMAAQALVRPSYAAPVETFHTNVVGTAVVLEAARAMPSLKAIIVVTSDKCYENREWVWPYRETDPLGGADPYSASKGCTEIVAAAYRRSFFSAPGGPRLATVRAGNVFGGGDWAVDRLVPDIIRAAIAGCPVVIRNPRSVRPWQHVLEPLSGYLALAARLLAPDGADFADAWNFGPDQSAFIDVETLARGLVECWGTDAPELAMADPGSGPHEAAMLTLDSSRAQARLGWRPRLSNAEAVAMTAAWYRAHASGDADLRALSLAQIAQFAGGGAPGIQHQSLEGGTRQCA